METFSRGTRLDPWYVTGFTEGAGAFTYSRSGRQLALYFSIKLADRDRALIEAIRDFFLGAGRIYDGGGPTRPAVYYRVSRRDELPRIVAHFDAYPLRGAKAQAFSIWKQMVALKQAFRRPPREQLDALAARLSERP